MQLKNRTSEQFQKSDYCQGFFKGIFNGKKIREKQENR
jgi:hypothetical protein